MNFNRNRNWALLAMILVILGATALLEDGAMVIFILLGLLFLVRQFDNNSQIAGSSVDYSDDEDYWYDEDRDLEERRERVQQSQKPANPIYRHALKAVKRAGLDPDNVQVLVVDIGVMAFNEGSNKPQIYRTWEIPDDIDHLQPYVELRLPTQANGRVKFEVFDAQGNAVFIHEDYYNLKRGRNFINPASRMPIHDQLEMDDDWGLRVSADGVLLAEHSFNFADAHSAAFKNHIGEDGEITPELKAVMEDSAIPKMTLDDLLAYQEEQEIIKRSQS